ncbi:MAG: Fe-S oxidoreductase [Myxococcota bacterium]|jgi:Fe-S oxidoreductase
MSLILLAGLGAFVHGVVTRLKWAQIGRPVNRLDNPKARIKRVVQNVLLQKKLLQRGRRGAMHVMFFYGFLVLQTVMLAVVGEGLFGIEFELPIIGGPVLGFLQDFFSVLVLIAIAMAVNQRYIKKNPHVKAHSEFDAIIVLLGIGMLILTYFITNGWKINGDYFSHGTAPMFASHAFAYMMSGMSMGAQETVGTLSFWVHALFFVALLIWVPRGKHFHLITGPMNVFFNGNATHRSGATLSKLDLGFELGEDEELDEDNMVFGASTIKTFTQKMLFDSYACTECGRCQDVCPAYNTGKELTPKGLQVDLRAELERAGPIILAGKADDEGVLRPFVPEIFSEEFIFGCTTCGACVYQCPVDIEHIDTIVEMRRHMVLVESSFPKEAKGIFKNLRRRKNPWGLRDSRVEWAEGMGVPVLGEDGSADDFDVLMWVGCSGSFDEAAKKVSRSLVEVLQASSVKFAILGDAEQCTGDAARRLGEESLFQELAMENVAVMKEMGVEKLKIISQCPHCFNTLKNEYPQFGGNFEVIHHTDFIAKLIRDGKLDLDPKKNEKVTFHDSCYLGRHNDIYDSPRDIIKAATGEAPVEMPRNRENGMCCGAGGGRMWLEEHEGTRVNVNRVEEALTTNAKEIASACPFCSVMLTDGLKAKDKEEEVVVLDVAQLAARAIRK